VESREGIESRRDHYYNTELGREYGPSMDFAPGGIDTIGGLPLTVGTVHLVCNAHLDPVWLWEWEEGAAETLSTFRAAAELCREFPDFVFNHNEAVLYRWVEEFEPELFETLRRLVREGRWHIMGGWQLQPDANMPCGESFVRQILGGRRYFRDRFGVNPRTAVNLDSFGHSRGLVQILARSGYDSYLFCRPGPPDLKLPSEAFVWVGFDGSKVTAQRAPAHYNSRGGEARTKLETWVRENHGPESTVLLWGVGNHGGGPSRQDLGDLARFQADRPDVRVVHSTPERYFSDLAASRPNLPRVEHSLNPWAVGCYTSMARVKHKHRLLENATFSGEKMAAAAFVQGRMPYPSAEIGQAQADLAFSEFHDILPGSCVPAAEVSALRLLDHGLEIMSRVKARAFFALAGGQERAAESEIPILVYNPHPFRVAGHIEVEFQPVEPNEKGGVLQARLFHGTAEIPVQVEKEESTLSLDWRKKIVFRAALEPGVMSRFTCRLERSEPRPRMRAGQQIRIRREWGEVTISAKTGLVDTFRIGSSDFLKRGSFEPAIMLDNYDPWGTGTKSYRRKTGRFRLMSRAQAAWFSGGRLREAEPVRVIEDGPVRTIVEALLIAGRSFISQRYKIARQTAELEVETRILWNEKDRLLKLRVPTCLAQASCLGQVVYGVEGIPSNGAESVSQKWTAVVSDGQSLALTIINDRTYGCDFSRGELRLSLLRAAAYAADPEAFPSPQLHDRFVPRQDQGEHVFRFWIRGGPAEERLAAVDREALARNEAPYVLSFFPPGTGTKPQAAAVLEGEAVQMTALKKVEDGEDLVIRLFEPTGKPRSAILSLPWAGARTTVQLGAFEVKTLRFDRKTGRFLETDLLERPLPGLKAPEKGEDGGHAQNP